MKRLRLAFSTRCRDAPLVHVNWNSRTAAFDNDCTETIIRKALRHFRLGPVEHYVLVTSTSDGGRIEVTDDLLKRLPDGSSLDLVRISAFGSSDGERVESWALLEKPQPPLGPGKRPDIPPSTAKSPTRYNPSPEPVPVIQPRPSQRVRPASQRKPRPQPVRQSPSPLLHPRPEPSISTVTSPYAPTEVPSRPPTPPEGSSYPRYDRGEYRMRKPVVYLFPPRPLPEVAVSVHLVPQWSFTHIYPLVEPKREPDGRQAISWTVSASPDGTLVEKGTALELSYLFWEAAAATTAPSSSYPTPPSPPLSPTAASPHTQSATDTDTAEHFDPAAPLLTPSTPTAVLLPFAALLPYLDRALAQLTLHPAARTDFVTYWLPRLAAHPFVALRFLPQAVYARAAELAVRPAPDVVTRVMMLFRGVPVAEVESGVWDAARARVGEVDWAGVVGVKRAEARDESCFRVLEWGAMEVL